MNPARLQPPTAEQIAQLAYLIWEQEDRLHGRDMVHWLQAEEQLWADYRLDAGMLDETTMAVPVVEQARQTAKHQKKSKAEARVA